MSKEQNQITIRSSAAEYLTFVASTGDSDESVEMRYEDENIWLTQKMMAVLYDVSVSTINEHIKKISICFNTISRRSLGAHRAFCENAKWHGA